MPEKNEFTDILTGLPRDLAAVAKDLRALVLKLDPKAVEVVWPRQRIAGYGVGPKKMTEQYVYIAPQKAHVNFGFYRGAQLEDPSGLLEGTGKALRHVKIRSPEDIHKPALRALLDAAIAERQKALGLSK